MLEKLPSCCQLLLHHLFVILGQITANSEVNQMHAENVAICISPSLLWPADEMRVLKNEVPPLVHFMIDYGEEIFGPTPPQLMVAVERMQAQRKAAEEAEGAADDEEALEKHMQRHCTSLGSSADDLDEEDENFLKSSTLTASDSQLYVADDEGMGSPSGSTSPPVMRRQPNTKTVGHATSEPNSPVSTLRPAQEQAGQRPLPRTRLPVNQPAGGMAARTQAATWRQRLSESSSDWVKAGMRAQGSAMQVYRHRMNQAAARAEQAQQAAPPGGVQPPSSHSRRIHSLPDDDSGDPKMTPNDSPHHKILPRSSRTQLHPSATAFMDQLSVSHSPGATRNQTATGLDLDKAVDCHSLEELYAVYSMERLSGRPSMSLPTTPHHGETKLLTQSHSTGPSPKVTHKPMASQHVVETRGGGSHQAMASGTIWFRGASPAGSIGRQQPTGTPPPHSSPSMSEAGDPALFNAISQRLGLSSPRTSSYPSATVDDSEVRKGRRVEEAEDSSDSSSLSSSEDENESGLSLLSSAASPHSRSLEKQRGSVTSANGDLQRAVVRPRPGAHDLREKRPASLGGSISTSALRSMVTSRLQGEKGSQELGQPRRVRTESYNIPGPSQAKFEEAEFDQESYV